MKTPPLLAFGCILALALTSCSHGPTEVIDHEAVIQPETSLDQSTSGGEMVHRGIFGSTDRRCDEYRWHNDWSL